MTGSTVEFVLVRTWKVILRVLSVPVVLIARLLTVCCGGWFEQLDRKHRIKDDWYIIPFFFSAVFKYVWSVYRGKFQFWYMFERHVARNGNQPCISYPRPLAKKGEFELETYSYRETYDIVLRLSHLLYNEYDVREGQTVALDYTNKPMFIFMWFALWNIGAVPSFLNYNAIGAPLVHSIKIANVKSVFIDPQAAGPVKETEQAIRKELPDVKLHFLTEEKVNNIIMNAESPQFLQDPKKRSPPYATDFQPACLIYTSGTTGLPKSAIMSWRKAVIGCTLFGWVLRIKNDSTVFTAMPLYHSTAALLGVCAVFSQGGCVAISNKFSASSFWKQACMTRSTHIQYVGEICRYLLHTPVSKFESQHCVKVAYGNGLRADIWQEFRERFGIEVIGEFYASTEAPFATTTFQRGDFGIGACRSYGTIINTVLSLQQTIIRVEPDDETTVYRNKKGLCEVAPPGEPGEMLMKIFMPKKPEATFQGYLGNNKATKSKVLRDVFRKGDAWYRSGDLLKSDEHGLWYFIDRMGDTFRWKSENVSAAEVEDQIMVFANYMMSAVAVVGIKVPNHEGRAGLAVLELAPQFRNLRGDVKFLNDMLESLKKSLPKYALPTFVKFVDEIEHTDNHKIKKKCYKDQVLPHGAGGDEILYWLKDSREYRPLTNSDWLEIMSGASKL
ncbi:long-chain fatty acid transporter FAT1 [Lachancea thermotolerans CBS 6340]|uniref:Very long-chain fatty acid transport protein n=1 Tax=Lachancea thermotolerans (strain ATCC 56472 / CBS 6340 / NRRL Y-8284) TaxID=559295 RepID=C5DEC7_LACTC|nr:KLTH0C08118p [Lachancea thermotolerans CBS 6340]CAR22138.1 KLTH0C08118p [Lachancea thermotolerans CBS 6340]